MSASSVDTNAFEVDELKSAIVASVEFSPSA
jgi:hypothetical protein